MKGRVFATAAAALVLVLGVESALAGQNAGATARMYWQVGTALGDTSRNSTTATAQVVVTVKGVKNFRGADVQLKVQGCSGSLPPAWQFQTGGCAEGAVDFRRGGFGGTTYPNVFTASPALSNPIQAQGGMYYQYPDNPCIAPDSTGTVWLSCAGAAGVDRDSTKEYAVLAFRLDLSGASTGGCQGDLADSSGPLGVLIAADHHIPCGFPPTGAFITLVDSSAEEDYAVLEAGFDSLTWECSAGPLERPIIQSVEPQMIRGGQASWLTVRGRNLGSVSSVTLRNATGQAAAAASVYAPSAEQVQALVDPPASFTGALSLAVSGVGGSDSLPGALTAGTEVDCNPFATPGSPPNYVAGRINMEGIHYGGTLSEPGIAVGPSHIFCIGPGDVRVFDKTGNLLLKQCENVFFRTAQTCTSGINPVYGDGGGLIDATCFYDPVGRRYLALCMSYSGYPRAHLHLAVSQSSDAMGGWYFYHMPAPYVPDRPILGVSADKICITANDEYGASIIRVLDRNSIYDNILVPYTKPDSAYPDSVNFYDLPCTYCYEHYRVGRNLTLDQTLHLTTIGELSSDAASYRSITGPASSASLSAAASIPLRIPLMYPVDAPQKGSGVVLANTFGGGYQNPSDLYVRHGVLIQAWHQGHIWQCGDTTDVIHVLRFRASSPTDTMRVDTIFGDPTLFCAHPGVCDDSLGNIYLGFDASATGLYPSCYFTAKRPSDSTIERVPLLVKGGEVPWTRGNPRPGRWGDFTSVCVDESESPPVAYYIGQWGKQGTPDTLGTWIRSFYFFDPGIPVGVGRRTRLENQLGSPFPNPVSGVTHVKFSTGEAARVRLEIVDVQGRRVRLLLDKMLTQGEHAAAWDGRDDHGDRRASGVYFCRMVVGAWLGNQKLVLLR